MFSEDSYTPQCKILEKNTCVVQEPRTLHTQAICFFQNRVSHIEAQQLFAAGDAGCNCIQWRRICLARFLICNIPGIYQCHVLATQPHHAMVTFRETTDDHRESSNDDMQHHTCVCSPAHARPTTMQSITEMAEKSPNTDSNRNMQMQSSTCNPNVEFSPVLPVISQKNSSTQSSTSLSCQHLEGTDMHEPQVGTEV